MHCPLLDTACFSQSADMLEKLPWISTQDSMSDSYPLGIVWLIVLCEWQRTAQKDKRNNSYIELFWVFFLDNVENRMKPLLIFSTSSISHSSQVVLRINGWSRERKAWSLNVVQSWHFTQNPSDEHQDQAVCFCFSTQMTVFWVRRYNWVFTSYSILYNLKKWF